MPTRYAFKEGYCLSAAGTPTDPQNTTVAAATLKSVAGREIEPGADVDRLEVIPFATASVTDAGVACEFHFVGKMLAESGTWDTNPFIVRVVLDNTGANKGPKDELPVVGYRKFKLTAIRNRSATAALTVVNVEYRTMRSRSGA